MDSGEEIPSLNEGYTLFGAKISEWVAGITTGFISMFIAQEFFGVRGPTIAPLLFVISGATTIFLRTTRIRFPDEERGMMNAVLDSLGFTPPGLPDTARNQPYWSGGRIRRLPDKSNFNQLDLLQVVCKPESDKD